MKSRMFSFVTKTWNPIVMHCPHDCRYCWAEALKKGRLKDADRYRLLEESGSDYILLPNELTKRFKKGDYVFVEDMGDLFADCVSRMSIVQVLHVIETCPDAKFLLMTKDPLRMCGFKFPENVLCGCTIETTHSTALWSKAPQPYQRFPAMRALAHEHKMICIEPIMDFSEQEFLFWIESIQPELVVVGYDNYSARLPEPKLSKTLKFIDALKANGFNVSTKTLREKAS